MIARYVRFRPVNWFNRICMRVEIYGCPGDFSSIHSMLWKIFICLLNCDECLLLNVNQSIPIQCKSSLLTALILLVLSIVPYYCSMFSASGNGGLHYT